MALPPFINRFGNLILRTTALREARQRVGRPTDGYKRAVEQVKMLVEVARRVAEPVEALPRGSRPAVLLTLYRDAVYWALAAEQLRHDGAAVPAPDLAGLWAAADQARLLKAAGSEPALTATRAALLERSASDLLTATEEDVSRARVFAENLLWELDTPTRNVERLQVQRWTRIVAVALVLVGIGAGLRLALRGPNLVANRVFKTSSSLPECTPPNRCADIFFHTLPQDNPWIDFDLGAVKTVKKIEVRNRTDCCSERVIPLIVEVSVDDQKWVEVAKRDKEFTEWSTSFPAKKARYVRLRIPRSSVLHLEDVAIR
jgi:hypothetical protein